VITIAIQNVFEIDVDIKQKTAIRTPTVTQNDAVVFIFRIFDEGRIYNVQEGSTFTMTSTRADKQAVMTVGEIKGDNIVQFDLGTTEIEVKGKVESVIQVYDATGRVSTIPFNYTVLNDPSGDYIPSEDEKTLIQKVLGEGPAILTSAQTATNEANTAADRANQAATEVEGATQDALTAANNANQVATNAAEVAYIAGQKAIEADTAAQGAITAKTAAETATQEAQQATNAINLVLPNVLNLEYIAPYNATTQYLKNNIVRLGKNSYIALQDSKGKEPTGTTDSQYWGVLAVGGLDGTGSVVSVNGVSPDENGNVTLVIPDPDLSGLATKDELKEISDKLTKNNDLAVTLNRGSQIITVDQDTPVNVLNIPGRTVVNHVPLFDSGLWKLHANATVNKPNKITLNATANNQHTELLLNNLAIGKKYFLSVKRKDNRGAIHANFIGSTGIQYNVENSSFTVPAGTTSINFLVTNGTATGIFEFEDITINEGTIPQPLVANVQGITNPTITRESDNLLGGFAETFAKDIYMTSSVNEVINDYHFKHISGSANRAVIQLSQLEVYTLSVKVKGSFKLTSSDVSNSSDANVKTTLFESQLYSEETYVTKTFTVPNGEPFIRFSSLADGTELSEWQINKGATALPFSKKDDQALTVLGTFHKGDTYLGDGKVVRKKKEEMLDDKLGWKHHSNHTGYKTVKFDSNLMHTSSTVAVKYNGVMLSRVNSVATAGADAFTSDVSTVPNTVWMTVSNSDSGWGQDYNTPTADEIKAYFLGWRMYAYDVGVGTLYNGTGTKAWHPINSWDGSSYSGYVLSLPTSPPSQTTISGTVRVKSDWQPYKLIYELEKPTTENVNVVGSVTLKEGNNELIVSEGRIVRERMNPVLSGGFYKVNEINLTTSHLKYSAKVILKVYKNGVVDESWFYGGGSAFYKGGGYAYIDQANFDVTAVYECDYEPLELYNISAPTNPMNIEYQSNLGAVVSEIINVVSDHDLRLDVVEMDMVRKDKPINFISLTVVNGWADLIQITKDDLNRVTLTGSLRTIGVTTQGTLVATIPVGFRPTRAIPILTWKSNTPPYDSKPLFLLQGDGKLIVGYGETFPTTGATNAGLSFEVSYLAVR